MSDPLFRRDSVTWRINKEPALLLGGGRALLMQLAHPGVAAGVADHSDFRRRPLHRLVRTLELTLALTFGSHEQAMAAARQINGVHQRIRGPGYSATDPRLLLWVHATLIDSALVTYEAFVRPPTTAERERYYQEAKLIGGLLGVPNAAYPSTFRDFEGYLDGALDGDVLRVDGRARELATAVLRPELGMVPAPVYLPLEALTAGLLPERLRREYGLRWGGWQRFMFAGFRRALPPLLRVMPAPLRQLPSARSSR